MLPMALLSQQSSSDQLAVLGENAAAMGSSESDILSNPLFKKLLTQLNSVENTDINATELAAVVADIADSIGESLPVDEGQAIKPEELTGADLVSYLMANAGDNRNVGSATENEQLPRGAEPQVKVVDALSQGLVSDHGAKLQDEDTVNGLNSDVLIQALAALGSASVEQGKLSEGIGKLTPNEVVTRNQLGGISAENSPYVVNNTGLGLARLAGADLSHLELASDKLNSNVPNESETTQTELTKNGLSDAELNQQQTVIGQQVDDITALTPMDKPASELAKIAETPNVIKADIDSKHQRQIEGSLNNKANNTATVGQALVDDSADLSSNTLAGNSVGGNKLSSNDAAGTLGLAATNSENTAINSELNSGKDQMSSGRVASLSQSDVVTVDEAMLDLQKPLAQRAIHRPSVEQQMLSAQEALNRPMKLATAEPLNERIFAMIKGEIQHAVIRLDPAELGQMEVRIQVQQEQTQIQIVVQTSNVREALEQHSARLREGLAEQGIDLASLDVTDQQTSEQEKQQSDDAQQGDVSGSDSDDGEFVNTEAMAIGLVDHYV